MDEHEEPEQLAERLIVVGGVEVGPVEVAADQPLDVVGGEGDEDRDDRRQIEGRALVAQVVECHQALCEAVDREDAEQQLRR